MSRHWYPLQLISDTSTSTTWNHSRWSRLLQPPPFWLQPTCQQWTHRHKSTRDAIAIRHRWRIRALIRTKVTDTARSSAWRITMLFLPWQRAQTVFAVTNYRPRRLRRMIATAMSSALDGLMWCVCSFPTQPLLLSADVSFYRRW